MENSKLGDRSELAELKGRTPQAGRARQASLLVHAFAPRGSNCSPYINTLMIGAMVWSSASAFSSSSANKARCCSRSRVGHTRLSELEDKAPAKLQAIVPVVSVLVYGEWLLPQSQKLLLLPCRLTTCPPKYLIPLPPCCILCGRGVLRFKHVFLKGEGA